MTSPAVKGQAPAPYGSLSTGTPSSDFDTTRSDMINVFLQQTGDLASNTSYYTGKSRPESLGIAVPQEMRKLIGQVGYPRLFIDSISERLSIEGFRIGGANEADTQLWDWWQANDLDTEAPLGHTEALVHGRAYITIAAPDPAVDLFVDPTVPIIRVESPSTLWANIDPRTRQVTQALRYITGAPGTSKEGQVVAATLYLPLTTIAWIVDDTGQWQIVQQVPHNLGVVPVVPIFNRTLLSSLYGTSEISPELRSVTDAACRILMDMQGAAELMAVPQRLLFGVKPQELGVDPSTGAANFDAYMARILAFADPEGKAFQFAAAELRNFGDALDQLDKKAAQITGLPPQYLSFSSQNPASAEAIQAAESRLVMDAEAKTKKFGGAWEQAMRIAYAVMNGGMQGLPPNYLRMESVWRDPSTPTYASKADAATKLYASGAGVIPKEQARIDMGYSEEERLNMQTWDQQESAALQLAGLYYPPTVTTATEAVSGSGAAPAPTATTASTATPSPAQPPKRATPAKAAGKP